MENDNVIPMSSRAIDLPASPLRSTRAEGELLGAPVVATLMSGKTVAGRLGGLDGARRILTLETRDKGRAYVRFPELRYLQFVNRNPVNRHKHPLQETHADETVMPRPSQEFRITFLDEKTINGRTRGSFVDQVGIHLFQLVDATHVSRLFIPSQSVRKYYIGQRRESQPKAHTAPPPPPAPRRRKTDRSGRPRGASDSAALQEALAARPGDTLTTAKRIGEMLVEDGVLSPAQLDAALQAQRSDTDARLGELIVRMGMAASEEIYRVLAHKFGMPFVLLRNFFIDIECLNLVPVEIARRYKIVPLLIHEDRLVVAMDDPANTEALTLLRFMTRYHIEPTIATSDDLAWAIGKYYGRAAPARANGRPGVPRHAARTAADEERNRQTTARAVSRFIENTIADAIERRASDIAMTTDGEHVDLLFRIDGAQVPIRRFGRVILPAVIQHLRHMGRLPAVRGDAPPHGRANVVCGTALVDVRIEVDARPDAERILIRLIETGSRFTGLDGLDLRTDQAAALRPILSRRAGGLLVVAGSPGTDRSQTLYAILREMQRIGRQVMTIEYPVSYWMDGVEHIRPEPDERDFLARALCQAQQDRPEGLLLGDLSGPEAMQAALAGALSGSLILARTSAMSVTGALAALMNLTRDHSALADSLTAVLAQQPVRVNCRNCLKEEGVETDAREAAGVARDEVFFRGAGCTECWGTGFSRTQSVFECLTVTPAIEDMIRAGAPPREIEEIAIAEGMVPIARRALGLARIRRIPFSEAQRLRVQSDDA